MCCEVLKELVPLYATGLLGEEEAAPLRDHLEAACPRCVAELAADRNALDLLPYAVPPQDPSPMAKARLMAAVRTELKETAPRSGAWGKAVALSAAASLVVALLTGHLIGRRYEGVTSELRRRIESQEAELAGLQQLLSRTRDTIRLVSSPGVKVIDLSGQEDRPEAAARVFWDRRHDSWQLYADNLPPAESGKTYQLWLVTADAKISAGTFDPVPGAGAAGRVLVPPEAGPVLAAAVTREPEGGSPQPTGKILLLGKI